MDNELEPFQNDLLASVRRMKAGKAARLTDVNVIPCDPDPPCSRAFTSEIRRTHGYLGAHLAGLGARPPRPIRRGTNVIAGGHKTPRCVAGNCGTVNEMRRSGNAVLPGISDIFRIESGERETACARPSCLERQRHPFIFLTRDKGGRTSLKHDRAFVSSSASIRLS